ncbi:copper resistance protein CopC [Arthrobacter bambusae]|jgi:copper resistance protein C|uniref:copper resistance CopC family protein n=1 Tax=Arthrobacter bambusae TaxID=1338426 RepID=UPI001F50B80B|nr:copper resistance CopC family protein [Arthrobacter bambusae]MCI0141072.1 copper resistance protein CopC [Arthrobacter bambusae]
MGARYRAGRLPRALAGFFLVGLLGVLALSPVSSAFAHDVLEGTEPANGSVVATVPSVVRLTFNNTPIALGSQILVKDANGTNQADGPVSIVDNLVSQAVKADAPPGRYTVVWRIVSSDTHPIEGSFTFTAGPGATAGSASPGAVPEPAGSTGFPWPVAVVVAGVLAAGLLAGGMYVRRRLSGNETGNEPADESGDDG